VFNEGYLHRADLTAEAIRLARLLHRLLPEEHEVAGLVALAGDTAAARECYRRAARMTKSIAEQQYLALRAAALA
jgi:hypothetical protein